MTEQDVLRAVRTRVPKLWSVDSGGVLRFNNRHCPITVLAMGVTKNADDWRRAARVLGLTTKTARRLVAATDDIHPIHQAGWDFDPALRRRLLRACGVS